MDKVSSQRVRLVDPRTLYASPPFTDQRRINVPGQLSEMDPKPDHGEKSYEGCQRLKGLSALITGGGSGIGRAVALCYAREGANVAINYLSESQDARDTVKLVNWHFPG